MKKRGEVSQSVIRIRKVSEDAERLSLLARAFEKETELSLPYYGEEMPSLLVRLVDEYHHSRRPYIPAELRAQLRTRQEDKCNACDDKLAGRGEVHHVKAVAVGGDNDPANLELLCHMCHAQKSEQQYLSKNPRLRSCFNPEMEELYRVGAPKPQQIHWGCGVYKDGRSLHPASSIDIHSCRRNEEYLPSFDFTD